METPPQPGELWQRVLELRARRRERKQAHRRGRVGRLSAGERREILEKTGRRCHLCGGEIEPGERWEADHVLAHSGGGEHAADNYLPAHGTCNNYRWDYLPEEFQLILKIGVLGRTQIEEGTPLGRALEAAVVKREQNRLGRRKGAEEDG